MNNAVIMQPYFTDNHVPMLRLTRHRHQKYADRHGFDYSPIDLRTIKRGVTRDTAETLMVELAGELLQMYEYIAWMDLDTLIYDVDEDLRNATDMIGAARFDADKPMPTIKDISTYKFYTRNNHLNNGVVYIHRTPFTIKFVEEWLPLSEKIGGWYSAQSALNVLAMKYELPDLDIRWNYTLERQYPCGNPVVIGYHSYHPVEEKIAAMKADLEGLT